MEKKRYIIHLVGDNGHTHQERGIHACFEEAFNSAFTILCNMQKYGIKGARITGIIEEGEA